MLEAQLRADRNKRAKITEAQYTMGAKKDSSKPAGQDPLSESVQMFDTLDDVFQSADKPI